MEEQNRLKNRKGCVIFSRELLVENPDQNVLKAIFSEFYPVAVENDHSYGAYQTIKMYGYSPYFEEIEEFAKVPTYEIVFNVNGNKVSIKSVDEIEI